MCSVLQKRYYSLEKLFENHFRRKILDYLVYPSNFSLKNWGKFQKVSVVLTNPSSLIDDWRWKEVEK